MQLCYYNNELSERAAFKRKRNRKHLFSTPRNRDFFIMSLIKSHNTFPIYIEKERKNDYGASQKVRISR